MRHPFHFDFPVGLILAKGVTRGFTLVHIGIIFRIFSYRREYIYSFFQKVEMLIIFLKINVYSKQKKIVPSPKLRNFLLYYILVSHYRIKLSLQSLHRIRYVFELVRV